MHLIGKAISVLKLCICQISWITTKNTVSKIRCFYEKHCQMLEIVFWYIFYVTINVFVIEDSKVNSYHTAEEVYVKLVTSFQLIGSMIIVVNDLTIYSQIDALVIFCWSSCLNHNSWATFFCNWFRLLDINELDIFDFWN